MRNFFAVIGVAGMLVVSATPAYAASAELDPDSGAAALDVSGDYGAPRCYASVDYFRADVSVQNTSPYVDVTTEGSIGGQVSCPIPSDPVGEVVGPIAINEPDPIIITHR